jgi:hypothetical protein
MYVDVRRRLVFFDKSISALDLVQYDVATGELKPVKGAQVDDVVTHVTNDGNRLALSSTKWLRVRGKNRHRLIFLKDGGPTYQTDKFMFFWARFDPSGNYALLSGDGDATRRPFVIEVNTGDVREQIGRNLDASFGDIDPLDGRLWAPDGGTDDFLLSVGCCTGNIKKIRIPLGGRATRVRFAHDGASLFVIGSNNVISCCDRDGSIVWSTNLTEYGENPCLRAFK